MDTSQQIHALCLLIYWVQVNDYNVIFDFHMQSEF
uniref:Uncharacterized protein n=1 Tax=Rhizophora mucronata TaxID=61149 RepID=A0A2P2K536_RHIMU